MNNFRQLRIRSGLSPAEVSDLLGICEARVIDYDDGTARPSARETNIVRGLAVASGQEHATDAPHQKVDRLLQNCRKP